MSHLYLALRYFRTRRGMTKATSGFALAGIILGVAALIVVMSVMAGFRAELMDRILGISGHITVSSSELNSGNAFDIASDYSNLEGVESVDPFVQGQAMVMSKVGASGILIRGIDVTNTSESKALLPLQKVVLGDAQHLSQPNTIMLGEALARKVRATVGTTVTLVSPAGKTTPFGYVPRMKKYRVVAIFSIGMHMYDSAWGYMSIDGAQKFYQIGQDITALDIRVNEPSSVDIYKEKIRQAGGIADPYIQSWKDANAQFFEALQVERVAMFIILALIVLVAAFNIITGQTMAVSDKRGDIAILRTMGARRRDILRIFLLNGLMIGVLGTALGVAIGVLIVTYLKEIVTLLETVFHVSIFSGEAYFLDEIPAALNMEDMMIIAGMSLTLSVLAALQPAMKAARMNPVEVLRS